ncbi:MAG: DNA polymerase III subunit alpha, partial [Chlorobia bacterium]|nr:DNA polymerase III subunit alpha [Fimbriimonadaceae bacterium]
RKIPRDVSQPQIRRFPERALNGDRYFRTSDEMAKLYADRPNLIAASLRIAEQCEDDVLPSRPEMPQLFDDDSRALREIVSVQAPDAYGPLKAVHRDRLEMELDRICRLGYASHFLVAWDFCRWAKEQTIQSSGRGSAVDSAVAYVLGFSRIDAITHKLHFDRFLPADGSKRPDIDIDFEAKRRDDIRGYMIAKYGVNRVGAVCAIGTYMTRGIVREVGKVMGLPTETVSFLSKRIHGGISANQLEAALEKRPELRDSNIPKEKFRWVMQLAERLMDVPRNIRTHSSGVVISDIPLADIVPVMWSATPASDESRVSDSQLRMIQWDKRSAKHFFDKFDVLCLRGQDVLSGIEDRVRTTNTDFSAERLPATTDPEVYRAMRSGELVGIPQSASPAMRQAHVRLKTNDLHDASLVQAGIRPGVGGAVKLNELIARRRGKPYQFSHPKLEEILGFTYGIIVFQEQVDQLLQEFCEYSGGEAEDIRDAIHKRRREDYGSMIKDKLMERMLSLGHPLNIAEEVFDYIAGFKGYGFAQGHALAFAEISLRCIYLMQHYPSEYFSALLSAQPAGYYGPATIANEARIRGVKMLGLDVNQSRELFQPESVKNELGIVVPKGGIRTGLMQLNGLSRNTKDRILEHQMAISTTEPSRSLQPLKSVQNRTRVITLENQGDHQVNDLLAFGGFFDFVAKTRPDRDDLESLILCGGLDSLCPNRRAMLWSIPQAQEFARLVDYRTGTLNFDYEQPPLDTDIEDFTIEEKKIYERNLLGMDVETHLVAFERERIASKGGITTAEAKKLSHGERAFAVGNPIRLRFPPTQSGKRVVFFDLEDETGLLNVTCFDDIYIRYGHAIVTQPYVTVRGEYQDRDGYPAFLATSVHPFVPVISRAQMRLPQVIGDFLVG